MVKRHASGRMRRRIELWQLMLSVAMVICLMRLCSARGMSDAEINEEIDFHKDMDTPPGDDDDDSYIREHPFSGGPNAAAEHESAPMSDEKRLTRHLLKKYDKAGVLGRPVVDTSTQLVVQFGVSLIQIIDLDEKSQVLTVNVWNTYRWNDTLLVWDPSNFGGVSTIRVPPYRIWTPDIVLFNYADDRLKEQRDALVTVNSDGSVKWMPTALLKSSCPINIRNFPFDVQHCHLKFGSWTFDERKLDIRQLDEHNSSMDTMKFTASKEWDLLSAPAVIDYRNMSSAADVKYPYINYTLNIRRVAVTYTFLLIIPCILLSVLNLVIFWLPPESPAKMMLGIMIFTAFFVLLQLLASLTPPAGEEPPLIGVYFCVNMIMITVSTFIAVFILYLYFRGDRKNTVPEVIRRVMLGTMVRVLCMENMMEKTGKPPPPPSAAASSSSAVAAAAAAAGDRHKAQQLPLIQRLSAASAGKSSKMAANVGNKAVLDLRPLAVEMARQYQVTPDKSPMHARALETDVKEVKRLIKNYVSRLSDKESVARAAKEWRNLSRVIDRIFFFMYLSVIVVSLATIFPTAPDVQ